MNFLKGNAVAVIALVIAVIALFLHSPFGSHMFGDISGCTGSTSCFTNLYASGQFQLSSTGTTLNRIDAGTCSLIAPSFSVSASTTVSMDCAVSGVVSGDLAFGMLPTSSPATSGPGWEITRASASTTAGFVTFSITNGTGATATIPASLASSTQYLVLH